MRAPALLLLLTALFGGCRTAPVPYPSFRTPEETWVTFKKAWGTGDVMILQAAYGGVLAVELKSQIELNGEAATSFYYSQQFSEARFLDEDFDQRDSNLAYLTARIAKKGAQEAQIRFSLVRFGWEWKIVALVVEDLAPHMEP